MKIHVFLSSTLDVVDFNENFQYMSYRLNVLSHKRYVQLPTKNVRISNFVLFPLPLRFDM